MRTTTPLAASAKVLLDRFHRQRPIRAGSLLITLFGDSIAPRGGSVALASLIELSRLFGLTDRLVRTSVGRLAAEGWVESMRSGRASFYSLTEQGRARFAQATHRIYAASSDDWDGSWTVVIAPATFSGNREALRIELRWLGFGQLSPGAFIHPAHDDKTVRAQLRTIDPREQLIVLREAHATQPSDSSLVQLGWDFADLGRRYRKIIEAFSALQDVAVEREEGALAFLVRTLLLHEYRKTHLRDPGLPTALLPQNWAGTGALETCRSVYAKLFGPSELYLSSVAETLDGELPPPGDEIYERFGGLPRLGGASG